MPTGFKLLNNFDPEIEKAFRKSRIAHRISEDIVKIEMDQLQQVREAGSSGVNQRGEEEAFSTRSVQIVVTPSVGEERNQEGRVNNT